MSRTGRPLSRRTVLRGLGTAVALPWLEAMTPRTLLPGARLAGSLGAAEPTRPQRFAFLFFPNGTHFPDWKPEGEGRDVVLSPLLEPLAEQRELVAHPTHAHAQGHTVVGEHRGRADGFRQVKRMPHRHHVHRREEAKQLRLVV